MLATVLFAALVSGTAGGWSGSVEAATDVPLHVGARFALESPHRLRLSVSGGVLPGPYVDLINASAVAAGAYDEDTATLVKDSLKRSLVLRAAAGWRPFRTYGFFAEAGYTWISLGGDVAGEDLIVLATGVDPPGPLAPEREYDVNSTLHQLGVELGWEWRLRARPLVVRAALGFVTTLDAETTMEPRFQPLVPSANERFTSESEAYLDSIYEDYVHVPVLSVSAGWRF